MDPVLAPTRSKGIQPPSSGAPNPCGNDIFRLQIQRKNKQSARKERESKQQRPRIKRGGEAEGRRRGGARGYLCVRRPRRAPAFELGVREETALPGLYKRDVSESRRPIIWWRVSAPPWQPWSRAVHVVIWPTGQAEAEPSTNSKPSRRVGTGQPACSTCQGGPHAEPACRCDGGPSAALVIRPSAPGALKATCRSRYWKKNLLHRLLCKVR